MNEFYRAKFNELFMEFTRYLITHPDFGEDIPKGAEVLDCHDSGYTNYMLKKAPKKDVVFIDVGKLAPIRSRLRKPKIISRPPAVVAIIYLKSTHCFKKRTPRQHPDRYCHHHEESSQRGPLL